MRSFKVGDIVVGNKYNEYGVAGRSSICKVVRMHNDFNKIRVRVIEPAGHWFDSRRAEIKERHKGFEYEVDSEYFDLKKPLLTENE